MSKEEQDAGVMMARHRRLISSGLLGLITVTCLSAGQSSAFGRSVKGEETDKGGFIGDFFQRFASRDECRFPCQMREREKERERESAAELSTFSRCKYVRSRMLDKCINIAQAACGENSSRVQSIFRVREIVFQ